MTPVCRYGQTWADWRQVAGSISGGRTERLTLEEGEWVIALTGKSSETYGGTLYLSVTTSTGRRWQQGRQLEDWSQRPSPALGGKLSHLSGRKTVEATVLCCHWTCG